jgi:DNA adenine methylase
VKKENSIERPVTSHQPRRPLLRWAGSKRQIVPLLLKLVPAHIDRYIEPFAGSASLFFSLAPRKAVISDTNADLINFYRVCRRLPKQLYEATQRMPPNKVNYLKYRSQDPNLLLQFDRAVRFYFLNRLCFNGVHRVNMAGRFNVPMGKKIPPPLEYDDFLSYARQLRAAHLKCVDFQMTIDDCGKGDFVYADPPYYGLRHRGEYGPKRFGDEDLNRLIEGLKKASSRGAQIALSYSENRKLSLALKGWKVQTVAVRRTVASNIAARSIGREALFTNFPITGI